MTPIDFLAASFIAVYAMIGGAVLNAAITAPANTLRVLERYAIPPLGWLLSGSLGLVIFSILKAVGILDYAPLWSNPLIWIAGSHLALVALLLLSQNIARLLVQAAVQTAQTPEE